MKRTATLLLLALFSVPILHAQERYEFDFRHNDVQDVARLLVALETGIDGSIGANGILFDLNVGAQARYSLSDRLDLQAKIRQSVFSLHFDPAYRGNFEFESMAAIFVRDRSRMKNTQVVIEGNVERSGGYVSTSAKYFNTDLPQRNFFGFNGGVSIKTLGINPQESDYSGALENLNFTTVSLIGGLQFKRVNASVIQVKKPRVDRIFDAYTVLSIDGIFAPVNIFRDVETGNTVGNEIRGEGFPTQLPFGARITYSSYGSIPWHYGAKRWRGAFSSSVGWRPYLGFHFDFGIGLMLLRS